MSGCLVLASSQMFCGSLCKPTCICLLAFQNVCYRCIHYGLGKSWTPNLPNKLCDLDSRYFNPERGVILSEADSWRDVVRLENQMSQENMRVFVSFEKYPVKSHDTAVRLFTRCKLILDSVVEWRVSLPFFINGN